MKWSAIAMILFSAVAVNHLGLITAVEKTVGRILKRDFELPIINCPKCLTFWLVIVYGFISDRNIVVVVAVALLCAYMAIWTELLMGMVDKFYHYVYGKIYPAEDTADNDQAGAAGTMPGLRTGYGDSERQDAE